MWRLINKRSFAKKMNRKEFLMREITENPEFFNAFPHLAPEGRAFIQSKEALERAERQDS